MRNKPGNNQPSPDSPDAPVDTSRRRLLLAFAGAGGALAVAKWPAAAAQVERVRIVLFDNSGRRLGTRMLPRVVKTEAEWKRQLAPLAYRVTRHEGTERAFSGHYQVPQQDGIYRCICCDTALFDVGTMFHSGTGWPSFWQPIAEANVRERVDNGFWMQRTEIECTRCAAHLGHVFNDGPPPTGLRYCMNSVALRFAVADASRTDTGNSSV